MDFPYFAKISCLRSGIKYSAIFAKVFWLINMYFRTPAEFCGAKVAKKAYTSKILLQFASDNSFNHRFPGYLCPVKDWGSFPNPLCHPQAHTHSLRITAFPPQPFTVSHFRGRGTRFPGSTVHCVPILGTRYTFSRLKCSPCPISGDAVRVFPPKPFTVSPTLGRGARCPRQTAHRFPARRCAVSHSLCR